MGGGNGDGAEQAGGGEAELGGGDHVFVGYVGYPEDLVGYVGYPAGSVGPVRYLGLVM